MPRGASPKREREYAKLKQSFKKSGRYKGRKEEVASRIVNKQRAQFGETRAEKQKDRKGQSPDRRLPIKEYQHLTTPQVSKKLLRLKSNQLRKVAEYEKKHAKRKTVLREVEDRLQTA